MWRRALVTALPRAAREAVEYAVRDDEAVAVLVRLSTLAAVDPRFSDSISSLTASTLRRYAPPPPPPPPPSATPQPAADRGVPPTHGPPPPSLHGALLFQKFTVLGAPYRDDTELQLGDTLRALGPPAA